MPTHSPFRIHCGCVCVCVLVFDVHGLPLNLRELLSYQSSEERNAFPPIFCSYQRKVFCCWCCVAQSCPTLWDPMDCSTPGLPVLHNLLELTQTHVHWLDDAIQPSHPLSSPSPPAFSLSQQQEFFLMSQLVLSGGWSIRPSASVLSMNI